jgi:hypothetical protein
MGIEPTSEAWEASILPLYDARWFRHILPSLAAAGARPPALRHLEELLAHWEPLFYRPCAGRREVRG